MRSLFVLLQLSVVWFPACIAHGPLGRKLLQVDGLNCNSPEGELEVARCELLLFTGDSGDGTIVTDNPNQVLGIVRFDCGCARQLQICSGQTTQQNFVRDCCIADAFYQSCNLNCTTSCQLSTPPPCLNGETLVDVGTTVTLPNCGQRCTCNSDGTGGSALTCEPRCQVFTCGRNERLVQDTIDSCCSKCERIPDCVGAPLEDDQSVAVGDSIRLGECGDVCICEAALSGNSVLACSPRCPQISCTDNQIRVLGPCCETCVEKPRCSISGFEIVVNTTVALPNCGRRCTCSPGEAEGTVVSTCGARCNNNNFMLQPSSSCPPGFVLIEDPDDPCCAACEQTGGCVLNSTTIAVGQTILLPNCGSRCSCDINSVSTIQLTCEDRCTATTCAAHQLRTELPSDSCCATCLSPLGNSVLDNLRSCSATTFQECVGDTWAADCWSALNGAFDCGCVQTMFGCMQAQSGACLAVFEDNCCSLQISNPNCNLRCPFSCSRGVGDDVCSTAQYLACMGTDQHRNCISDELTFGLWDCGCVRKTLTCLAQDTSGTCSDIPRDTCCDLQDRHPSCSLACGNCFPGICEQDGYVDIDEECDPMGPNLDGATCVSLGRTGGQLGCSQSCLFDMANCEDCTGSCRCPFYSSHDISATDCEVQCQTEAQCAGWSHNAAGIIQGRVNYCAILVFNSNLAALPQLWVTPQQNRALWSTQCNAPATLQATCSIDGTAIRTEECDPQGPDLKGLTCASLGFYGGLLKCTDQCKLDTSSCHAIPSDIITISRDITFATFDTQNNLYVNRTHEGPVTVNGVHFESGNNNRPDLTPISRLADKYVTVNSTCINKNIDDQIWLVASTPHTQDMLLMEFNRATSSYMYRFVERLYDYKIIIDPTDDANTVTWVYDLHKDTSTDVLGAISLSQTYSVFVAVTQTVEFGGKFQWVPNADWNFVGAAGQPARILSRSVGVQRWQYGNYQAPTFSLILPVLLTVNCTAYDAQSNVLYIVGSTSTSQLLMQVNALSGQVMAEQVLYRYNWVRSITNIPDSNWIQTSITGRQSTTVPFTIITHLEWIGNKLIGVRRAIETTLYRYTDDNGVPQVPLVWDVIYQSTGQVVSVVDLTRWLAVGAGNQINTISVLPDTTQRVFGTTCLDATNVAIVWLNGEHRIKAGFVSVRQLQLSEVQQPLVDFRDVQPAVDPSLPIQPVHTQDVLAVLPNLLTRRPPTPSACNNERTFLVNFTSSWSSSIMQRVLPPEAAISDVIVISHSSNVQPVTVGSRASTGMRLYSLYGQTALWLQEIRSTYSDVDMVVHIIGGVTPPGSTFGTIQLTATRPVISIYARVIPSPDWILAVTNIHMCNTERATWLDHSLVKKGNDVLLLDVGVRSGNNLITDNVSERRTLTTEPIQVQRVIDGITPHHTTIVSVQATGSLPLDNNSGVISASLSTLSCSLTAITIGQRIECRLDSRNPFGSPVAVTSSLIGITTSPTTADLIVLNDPTVTASTYYFTVLPRDIGPIMVHGSINFGAVSNSPQTIMVSGSAGMNCSEQLAVTPSSDLVQSVRCTAGAAPSVGNVCTCLCGSCSNGQCRNNMNCSIVGTSICFGGTVTTSSCEGRAFEQKEFLSDLRLSSNPIGATNAFRDLKIATPGQSHIVSSSISLSGTENIVSVPHALYLCVATVDVQGRLMVSSRWTIAKTATCSSESATRNVVNILPQGRFEVTSGLTVISERVNNRGSIVGTEPAVLQFEGQVDILHMLHIDSIAEFHNSVIFGNSSRTEGVGTAMFNSIVETSGEEPERTLPAVFRAARLISIGSRASKHHITQSRGGILFGSGTFGPTTFTRGTTLNLDMSKRRIFKGDLLLEDATIVVTNFTRTDIIPAFIEGKLTLRGQNSLVIQTISASLPQNSNNIGLLRYQSLDSGGHSTFPKSVTTPNGLVLTVSQASTTTTLRPTPGIDGGGGGGRDISTNPAVPAPTMIPNAPTTIVVVAVPSNPSEADANDDDDDDSFGLIHLLGIIIGGILLCIFCLLLILLLLAIRKRKSTRKANQKKNYEMIPEKSTALPPMLYPGGTVNRTFNPPIPVQPPQQHHPRPVILQRPPSPRPVVRVSPPTTPRGFLPPHMATSLPPLTNMNNLPPLIVNESISSMRPPSPQVIQLPPIILRGNSPPPPLVLPPPRSINYLPSGPPSPRFGSPSFSSTSSRTSSPGSGIIYF